MNAQVSPAQMLPKGQIQTPPGFEEKNHAAQSI